jgi:hypothetical protein
MGGRLLEGPTMVRQDVDWKESLDVGSSRFWIGWVTKRGDKCARSTCRD